MVKASHLNMTQFVLQKKLCLYSMKNKLPDRKKIKMNTKYYKSEKAIILAGKRIKILDFFKKFS